MTRVTVRCHVAPNRLADLAARPGGKRLEAALADATRNIGDMRDECEAGIRNTVLRLETLTAASGPAIIPPDKAREALALADTIVLLSGTYGFAAMETAAMGLVDLIVALSQRDGVQLPPVRVHVRAMRLMEPCAAQTDPAETAALIAELDKVRAHLGV